MKFFRDKKVNLDKVEQNQNKKRCFRNVKLDTQDPVHTTL